MGKLNKFSSTQLLDVAVIEDSLGFAALKEEWEDLYRNSRSATPFQSWAWLYSWWESYGGDYDLRLITIKDNGLLVGIVPLMLKREALFKRLLFLGTGITDYHDVLIREGWESRVLEAAGRALRQIRSWDFADLQELRPSAAAWGIFRDWNGYKLFIQQSNCLEVDVKLWDELLADMSSKRRSNIKRNIRRARADGMDRRLAAPLEAEEAGRRMLALHKQQWEGRGINPEHLTPRFQAHIASSVRRMAESDMGGIVEFCMGSEVVASHFLMFGRDFVGGYLFGAKEEALSRYQMSAIYIENIMSMAIERNSNSVKFLRGEEPYKQQWNTKVVSNYRIILGRNPVIWALYAGYHVLRSRLTRYLKSGSAPSWTKGVVSFLRGR